MKQTMFLTNVEWAAYVGVTSDVERLRNQFHAAEKLAADVIYEIAAQHKVVLPANVTCTPGEKDGRHFIDCEEVVKQQAPAPSNGGGKILQANLPPVVEEVAVPPVDVPVEVPAAT